MTPPRPVARPSGCIGGAAAAGIAGPGARAVASDADIGPVIKGEWTMAGAPTTDEVDRAVAGVRRAIGRLIALLDADDPATIEQAARELAGLGAAAAVGPLAEALARGRSPRHRGAILGTLFHYRKNPGPP